MEFLGFVVCFKFPSGAPHLLGILSSGGTICMYGQHRRLCCWQHVTVTTVCGHSCLHAGPLWGSAELPMHHLLMQVYAAK